MRHQLSRWTPLVGNWGRRTIRKVRLTLHQIVSIGSAGPMNRPTLYFRLSLIWLVILACGVAFLWFG